MWYVDHEDTTKKLLNDPTVQALAQCFLDPDVPEPETQEKKIVPSVRRFFEEDVTLSNSEYKMIEHDDPTRLAKIIRLVEGVRTVARVDLDVDQMEDNPQLSRGNVLRFFDEVQKNKAKTVECGTLEDIGIEVLHGLKNSGLLQRDVELTTLITGTESWFIYAKYEFENLPVSQLLVQALIQNAVGLPPFNKANGNIVRAVKGLGKSAWKMNVNVNVTGGIV